MGRNSDLRSCWSLCQRRTSESVVGLLMGAWESWRRAARRSAKCWTRNLGPRNLLRSTSLRALTVTVSLEYFCQ